MRTESDALRSLQRYVWQTLAGDTSKGIDGTPRPWEIRYWDVEGTFDFPFARIASITPQVSTGPASVQDIARTYTIHAYPTPQDNAELSVLECSRVEEMMHLAFNQGFLYTDPLAAPYGLAFAQGPIGGLLASGSRVYAVSAVSLDGESVVSDPVTVTLVGSTSVVALGWNETSGAQSYNIYAGVDLAHLKLLVNVKDSFYLDDGSVATGATSPPVSGSGTVNVRSAPKRIPLYDYVGVPLDGAGSVSYRRGSHDYLVAKTVSIDRLVDPEDDRYWLVMATVAVTWRRSGRMPLGSQIVQSVKLVQAPG